MNPKNHAPRILLSVYACSPEWGSEVGTGWHCQNFFSST